MNQRSQPAVFLCDSMNDVIDLFVIGELNWSTS
ncbi:MAG: hypothetical protein ACI92S_001183 [Planctomycetaceae bacterium]|jgi:hypothetical protein